MKPRTKTILLYIFTFGIAYAIAKSKAKKIAKTVNTTLKVNTEINFDINQLIKDLGTKENIESVSSTLNCLIVNLKDKTIINVDDFKKYNLKGMYFAGNKLNMLFGDISKHLEELLNSNNE